MEEKTKSDPNPPQFTWKVVAPRHYDHAQALAADAGKSAQRAYILRLLQAVDGVVLTSERIEALPAGVIAAAVAEFDKRFAVPPGEEKFGGKE